MSTALIDPLQDSGWQEFVARHPRASAFHTRKWLLALRNTYGHKPVAIVERSSTGNLQNAIVLCTVDSWITGRRLVSVPFADHCDPLVENSTDLESLLAALEETCRLEEYKYAEMRPLSSKLSEPVSKCGFVQTSSYGHHSIDLVPEINELYADLHASCVQRKIRRAESMGLDYRTGRDEETLRHFYRLLMATRRRHGVITQPFRWFQQLAESFANDLTIHLAFSGGVAVAGIVTIRHADTLLYKYGASDENYHHLGGMPFLFWKAILYGKSLRLKELDLGRTDVSNPGLMKFKERLGGRLRNLAYYRSNPGAVSKNVNRCGEVVMRVCTQLPDSLYCAAGEILYKHSA